MSHSESYEMAALWERRRARTPSGVDRLVLSGLMVGGLVAMLHFFDFWFRAEHVANGFTFVLLSMALWYGISRIVLGWIAVHAIRVPEHVHAREGLSVAIFTTSSPGEPLSMFERTLAACSRIRYPHTTYLLDDTRDRAFAEVARRHGAVHLELLDLPGAKAGKINAALKRTHEDFVLVLDPDHVPFPEFLERVLGHFDDPRVGFVQVCQAYYNQGQSAVARGAAEQTYAFYGPTQMGLNGLGCVLSIGANCTFRRTALEAIGGHGVGLAEDLVTAVHLHGAGYRGVYVPEVLSRGLVPEDLRSFFQQQLKWARGVYEVLFVDVVARWASLRGFQRLTLLTVGTYYLFGVSTLIYMLIPHLAILFGLYPVRMNLAGLAVAGLPLVGFAAAVHFYAQRFYCDPRTESGLNLRGLALKIVCWPVFCQGLWLALGNRFVRYVPTSKRRLSSSALPLCWPLFFCASLTLASSAVVGLRFLQGEPTAIADAGMLMFSWLSTLFTLPAIVWALHAKRTASTDAWNEVPSWLTRRRDAEPEIAYSR